MRIVKRGMRREQIVTCPLLCAEKSPNAPALERACREAGRFEPIRYCYATVESAHSMFGLDQRRSFIWVLGFSALWTIPYFGMKCCSILDTFFENSLVNI